LPGIGFFNKLSCFPHAHHFISNACERTRPNDAKLKPKSIFTTLISISSATPGSISTNMKNTYKKISKLSLSPIKTLRNRSGKALWGSLLAAISILISSSELRAETFYSWNASSGLFPDQVAPVGGSITLTDSSSLDVAFDNELDALTFPDDTSLSSMLFYRLNFGDGSDSAPSNPFENGYAINFEVRIDSSIQTDNRRGAIAVTMRTGQSRYSLSAGIDYVRMIRDFEAGSPVASVDTNGSFHTYRIEVDGVKPGSAIRLFQDGGLILNASTGLLDPGESEDISFGFGEGSGIARGTSQWRSYSVEAIPEPSSALFLGLVSLGSVLFIRRRF